jgi:hypothetical protein
VVDWFRKRRLTNFNGVEVNHEKIRVRFKNIASATQPSSMIRVHIPKLKKSIDIPIRPDSKKKYIDIDM